MKKSLLLFALLFSSFLSFSQTIRRVNNTSGLNDPSVYATAQAAHDAAKDGDIIQLESSDNPNYGSLDISKKLTIYGTGFDLVNATNASFDKRNPQLGAVTFNAGSAKSVVIGLEITGELYLGDESISISRCKVLSSIILGSAYKESTATYTYSNKLSINQSLCTTIISYSVSELQGNNCTIINNIFQGSGYIRYLRNSVISNNIFQSSSSSPCLSSSTGCIFSNNIIDARDGSSDFLVVDGSVTGSTVSNNLCTTFTGLPTGGGNVNKANATTIFKVANPWEIFIDSNLQLADKSPAKTVGAGSTAIGAYAGGNPYVPSGIPAGPAITSFMSSGFGSSTTPINITTSVRSNN
jgi:hypothetical protein